MWIGHFNHPQIIPTVIPNLPSNIVQFVSGNQQNLFLDSDGNVFSFGENKYGQLGLGHNKKENVLNHIIDIPIQIISCISFSCYLVDLEGNVWCLGVIALANLDMVNSQKSRAKCQKIKEGYDQFPEKINKISKNSYYSWNIVLPFQAEVFFLPLCVNG